MPAGFWAAVLALEALALAISGYLTYAFYKVREGSGWQSFCDIGANLSCDAVSASQFSAIGPIPIAWFGVVFYAAVAWLALLGVLGRRPVVPRSPTLALLAAGVFASALSVVLGVLSARAIGVYCPLCLALYVLNAALLVLGILAFRRGDEPLRAAVSAETANVLAHPIRTLLILGVVVALLAGLPLVRPLEPDVNQSRLVNVCAYLDAKRASGDRAPAEIIVYVDFQCPFCKKADAALAPLRKSDRAVVTTRHFPLDNACNPMLQRAMHPGACTQAAAAICAGERGDEFAEHIFASRAADIGSLVRLAERLGLDPAAFEACLQAPETARRIDADLEAAQKDAIRGTPSIFVDGRKYDGPIDSTSFDCRP